MRLATWQIHRVLTPGGLLVWGNALPTDVWKEAPARVMAHGFRQVLSENVTKGAIEARDLDAPRVNAFWDSWGDACWVTSIFGRKSTCGKTLEMLVKNFYRHPGTALYNTMVTGHDSYCRHAYKKHKRGGVGQHAYDTTGIDPSAAVALGKAAAARG